ncbi:DNA repair protein RecN [Candidiatus Paracoxiella cheracis]|uniref:DNA repair protein RecN n=1 Tax=Candidiatus Paracoxiella cheracis TaxID=3405120 RepID=UPI003BF58FD4
MLSQIYLKNYTVVKSLNLELNTGLTVLTGETGAGKSIIVDAVMLALGARADTNAIRLGEDQCDITLSFDLTHIPEAKTWLESQDFAEGTECLVRRTISRDGRSRSTINGHPCSQNLVREFSTLALAIHGQHQHQELLKREIQQQQLDVFAHHESMLSKIQQHYHQWRKITAELDTLSQQTQDRDRQLDLLRYQLEELTALNLQENEWETLSHQHQKLHNAQNLIDNLNEAIDLTVQNEQTSAAMLLQEAIDRINEIKISDNQITAIKELLGTAAIHLQEAGDELSHYRNNLDLSDENINQIEQRLSVMHDLARKHHVNPNDLLDVKKSLEQRVQKLENIDANIETLRQHQAQISEQYQAVANALSQGRVKAAKTLEKNITEKMQSLGMNGGEFKIQFEKINEIISPYGNEKISFIVCTNPGQGFLPLQKVVSGGELSRISLALQVITAQKEGTPTLIFDEVDTGIGGKTAEIVGQLLCELGQKAQVICITHLPQVAAQGTHQFKVEKTTSTNSVCATIRKLNQTERVEELARMLSGSKITEQTLAHARELLSLPLDMIF